MRLFFKPKNSRTLSKNLIYTIKKALSNFSGSQNTPKNCGTVYTLLTPDKNSCLHQEFPLKIGYDLKEAQNILAWDNVSAHGKSQFISRKR